jgi:hypothetical protein
VCTTPERIPDAATYQENRTTKGNVAMKRFPMAGFIIAGSVLAVTLGASAQTP